jgi:hypothetical protein
MATEICLIRRVAEILCCVTPAVAFMFGLMVGAVAISFADFFYNSNGSVSVDCWILRGFTVVIVAFGVYLFGAKRKKRI